MASLFDRFRARRDKPDNGVAAAEKELADHTRESEIAQAELAALHARRRSALLAATDAEIGEIDRALDRLNLQIERLEAMRPILLGDLEAAKGAARARLWGKLRDRYLEAAVGYAAALRGACAALENLRKLDHDIAHQGFEHELAAIRPSVPFVVDRESAERYLLEIERRRDAENRRREEQPSTPRVTVASVDSRPTSTAPLLDVSSLPLEAPRPVREEILDVAGEGEVLVRVERSGYTDPKGRQCAIGDVIALSEGIASIVVCNGAAEYVSPGPREVTNADVPTGAINDHEAAPVAELTREESR